MTITIDLAPEVLARRHDKAAREREDSEAIAARLVAEALE
jgi:ribose 1,5-bisphosphokinase PhnN